jgi:hypothetical protein
MAVPHDRSVLAESHINAGAVGGESFLVGHPLHVDGVRGE